MSIKNVQIDYESFDGANEKLIREWVADEYDKSDSLAVNTTDDGLLLTKGTGNVKKGSNRQIGDRPKTLKTYRLNPDIAESLEAESKKSGRSQVEILEAALKQYLS